MAPIVVRLATALTLLCSCAHQYRYGCSATEQQQQQQQSILPSSRHPDHHQQQPAAPPAVLKFTNPANGSTVDGPNVHLTYMLNSARGDGGRELTTSEIEDLTVSVTMCFELKGFEKPEACAPLQLTSVTIKEAVPAKWHTVTAMIKSSSEAEEEEEWKNAGDAVSVFVGLEGYPDLAKDMCGDSACLDTTNVRSAYFDHVYRWVLGTHSVRLNCVCVHNLYRSGLR